MSKNYFISGEWNVTCDVCSRKIKAGLAKQRWDGFIVCPDDYEQRHAQDFVKARQDKISVPFQRPLQTPAYFVCTLESTKGIAGVGIAGCMVAGKLDIYGK
jgi:hypothetical protein